MVDSEDEEILRLNYLDAAMADLPAVCAAIPALAGRLGKSEVRGKPVAAAPLIQALEETEWEIEADFEMWIFERKLANNKLKKENDEQQ